MKIEFTQDFKDKVLRAEGGVKFVLKGFVLSSSADSVETLDDVRKLNLITNGNDPDKDFIEQLFNVAYTPALEIGKFGTYKLFLPKLTHAVTAILIGECYNESRIAVVSTNEYFVAGTIRIEDAATTDVNVALTVTFNDEEVSYIAIDSDRHDAGTVKFSTNDALWLVPSLTDQQKAGLEEEIEYTIGEHVDTSAAAVNVLPITERNDAPWNEPVQFSVWDENIPGKPQMLLSYGSASGADSEFGFERGQNYFAMNAKTDEPVNYSLLDNDATFTSAGVIESCRILGENDELALGSNDMLLKTKNAFIGGMSSSGSCNNFLMKANDVHVVDSSLLNFYGVTLKNLNHVADSSDVSVINSQDINVTDSENGLIINSTGITAKAKNFIAMGANDSDIKDDNAIVAGPNLRACEGAERSLLFGMHNAHYNNVNHTYFRWTVSDGYYIPEAHPTDPSTGQPIDVSEVTPIENASEQYARFMKRIDAFSVERGSLPGIPGMYNFFALRNAFAGGEIKGQGVKPGQLWNVSDTYYMPDCIMFTKPEENSDNLATINIRDMKRFIDGEFDNVPAAQVDTSVAGSEVAAAYRERTSVIYIKEPKYTGYIDDPSKIFVTDGDFGNLAKIQKANAGHNIVITNTDTVITTNYITYLMGQLFQQGVNSWDYSKPFTFYLVNGSTTDMQFQATLEKFGINAGYYTKMIPLRAGECVIVRYSSTAEARGIINVNYA